MDHIFINYILELSDFDPFKTSSSKYYPFFNFLNELYNHSYQNYFITIIVNKNYSKNFFENKKKIFFKNINPKKLNMVSPAIGSSVLRLPINLKKKYLKGFKLISINITNIENISNKNIHKFKNLALLLGSQNLKDLNLLKNYSKIINPFKYEFFVHDNNDFYRIVSNKNNQFFIINSRKISMNDFIIDLDFLRKDAYKMQNYKKNKLGYFLPLINYIFKIPLFIIILFLLNFLKIYFFYKNLGKPNTICIELKELLGNDFNLIRWGDGETSLLYGKSINFQRSSPKLSLELLYLLFYAYFRQKKSNFILSISKLNTSRLKLFNFPYIINYDYSFNPFYFRDCPFKSIKIINKYIKKYKSVIYLGSDSPYQYIKHQNIFHINISTSNSYKHIGEINYYLKINLNYFYSKYKNNDFPIIIIFGGGPSLKVTIFKLTYLYPKMHFLDTGHLLKSISL